MTILIAFAERLVRNLASNSLISNASPHQYGLTDFTRSLADPLQHSVIRYLYDVNIPVFEVMPAYIAEEGYKNPMGRSVNRTAFTKAKELEGSFFDWLRHNPGPEKDFGMCMKVNTCGCVEGKRLLMYSIMYRAIPARMTHGMRSIL